MDLLGSGYMVGTEIGLEGEVEDIIGSGDGDVERIIGSGDGLYATL